MVVLQLKLADLYHMYSSVEDIFVIFGYMKHKALSSVETNLAVFWNNVCRLRKM